MKTSVYLSLILYSAAIRCHATNISVIDFSGSTSNVIRTISGQLLPNASGRIRIGYFDAAAQGASWLQDLQSFDFARISSAMSAFVPLGENGARPDLGAIPPPNAGPRITARTIDNVLEHGRLAGQVTSIVPVAAAPNTLNSGGVPAGSRIFLIVSSGNGAGFPNVVNGWDDWGVFSAETWLLSADGGLNLQLNTTHIDLPATEILVGQAGGGGLVLQPFIPEPSALFSFSGVAALMAARRRRR